MSTRPSIFEAVNQYVEESRHQLTEKQANQKRSELMTAIFLVIENWGFKRSNPGGKMTTADTEAASLFLKTVNVVRLLHARADLEAIFECYAKSQNSRRTYGGRLDEFLEWSQRQVWWPEPNRLRIENDCRPPRQLSGIRAPHHLPLTHRRGIYKAFRLKEHEMSPKLAAELDLYWKFLTAENFPGRVRATIDESSAKNYYQHLLRFLGYLHRFENVPLENLSLELLVPVVQPEDVEYLSPAQQKRLWREKTAELHGWLLRHFDFSREQNSALSPRGRLGKVNTLESLAFFLYRDQVTQESDYKLIPMLISIKDLVNQEVRKTKEWQQARRYVANQERKWPDQVENESILTTIRRLLVEPLRLECRPRTHRGGWRDPSVVATSLQYFLKWVLLTYVPPRRQHDHRTLRISKACPIERPDSVPADGLYFPIPPVELRERGSKGTVIDNYIARVYQFEGKVYPKGVWVIFLEAHKMDKVYGGFSMIIPDRPFDDDGTCLYDYFEWYFCGRWVAGHTLASRSYGWWDRSILGQRGHWAAPGWLDFGPRTQKAKQKAQARENSQNTGGEQADWCWGYAFVLPNTGQLADESSYAGSFIRTSKQYLKKRVSPHMLRYMWATWAFQVGLNERALHSLAYAMGHSVKTLREMYERCCQQEKLKPIEEAIDLYLFEGLRTQDESDAPPRVDDVAAALMRLTPEERWRAIQTAEDKFRSLN